MLQKKDKRKMMFFRHSTFKIAKLIFNYPNKTFHIREFSRKTGLSTTAVTSSLEELKKILIIEKTDITTNIRADLESESYRTYKRIFNLYCLERYLITDRIRDAYQTETIVLFGSFAKGEDIEESDIDLLIITHNKEPLKDIRNFLSICEKKMNRNINLHILPSIEKSPQDFKNALANGIVLQGYLKII